VLAERGKIDTGFHTYTIHAAVGKRICNAALTRVKSPIPHGVHHAALHHVGIGLPAGMHWATPLYL